ncbi:stalk domain-containing protein [Sporosarcina sp. ACRSL]|uniref:DUF6612 family protein n=1 Tax=Sporosarcina sp. ACRSL TaxID=2918215 RepID=UPI001EF52741|nr:DUF6612 family protein [Sporosarcina sp. ACRSL]MCG7346589.1 stalk domain-containing protein [Sporosarcina sp. ACRSL]
MRKLATWALAFVLVLSFAWPSMTASAEDGTLKLVVDGVEVEGYEQPFVSQGKVLIPVDNVFQEAGFNVTKEAPGKLNVTNTYLTLDFDIADQQISVNGKATSEVFPLTLRNYGNYITSDFLDSLVGFDVTVSEEDNTVNVTTNRVKDIDAFLEKMLAADLKSYEAKLTLDQSMEAEAEELSMNMKMDMDMIMTTDPIGLHMLSKMSMNMGEEAEELTTEAYFTKDGFFQSDGKQWTKFPAELSDGLLQASMAQVDPATQLQLVKAFMKGIHVFEYDDVYIITQTMTNEEFKSMMSDAMSLFSGLLPEGVDSVISEGSVIKEVEFEETVQEEAAEVEADFEEAATEEDAVAEEDAVTEEEAVEEEAADVEADLEEAVNSELEAILEMLQINIDKFFVVTVVDKATLFPQSTSGITVITMSMDGETVTIKQLIDGVFSKFNEVKEIKVPADVIKNAVTLDLTSGEIIAE